MSYLMTTKQLHIILTTSTQKFVTLCCFCIVCCRWNHKACVFMARNEWHRTRCCETGFYNDTQDLLHVFSVFHWGHLFHHNSRLLLFPLFIHNSSRVFCTNIFSPAHTSCTWLQSSRHANYSVSDTSNFVIITTVKNIECGCVKLLRVW